MNFKSIKIENLFAYAGENEVDLSGTTQERNIIVISGRNGAGKTSLLNAAKLLFLGSDNDRLRRVGFGGQVLSRRQFVLGQQGRWYGVFNAGSLSSFAAVSLSWDENGENYEAKRTFRRVKGGSDFEEQLRVTVNGAPLPDDERDAKLASLLPRDVVPFFFFDGEQIQSLADAEIGRETAEIERLLGFSFYAQLIEHIEGYAREKARGGLPDGVRLRIVEAENGEREARTRAETAGRSRVQEEEARLDLERRRDRLNAERERLRGGTLTESERRRIVARITVLEGQQEALAAKAADSIPEQIPFVVNQELTSQAFEQLNSHVARGADETVAFKLHRDLAPRLVAGLVNLTPPVLLTEDQSHEFSDLISSMLEDAGVRTTPGNPLFQSISPKRVAELRDQFMLWLEGRDFDAQRGILLDLRQNSAELRRLKQELDEAELTSEEIRARYNEISEQIVVVQSQLDDTIGRIAEHHIDEQRGLRDIAKFENIVKDLEFEFREVTKKNSAYQLALRTKRAFERFRDLRKQQVRASVEKKLNERVQVLLAPSELIRSIKLNEDFVMSYFDERGGEVARLSISAGMRQLLAMAMLWALKDEADSSMPVIVDTPLGRIDRTNRQLLMSEYFPRAAQPLVILPTDTEFGPDAYDLLAGHIRRRYRIENTGGDSARIVEETAFVENVN